ncbi:MAG: hypothetical protein KGS61_05580 [Verrucomicrobia bacterium]|nr:hypothetical protein [Verrucomicrobiota bacterium]
MNLKPCRSRRSQPAQLACGQGAQELTGTTAGIPTARPVRAADPGHSGVDRFEFDRDTFAFANELIWEYRFDPFAGKTITTRRTPEPAYAHRCFVLVRAARQFFYHARFDDSRPAADERTYRGLIRAVLARSPRTPADASARVVIPGYDGLRRFSRAWEFLLKASCGGAWRSYVLRSHWRMVFPIARGHQARTAARLAGELPRTGLAIVHLVRFPSLTINHGVGLFAAQRTETGFSFQVYDPNDPDRPVTLSFDRARRTFDLPANRYWPGGRVDVIEIFRPWFQ